MSGRAGGPTTREERRGAGGGADALAVDKTTKERDAPRTNSVVDADPVALPMVGAPMVTAEGGPALRWGRRSNPGP